MDTAKKTSKSKWPRRLIVAAVLLVLLVSGLHALLKSDLPRLGLQQILSSQFKINASMDSLQLHWNGSTRIQRFKITQPEYPLPLVTIQDVTLSHTSLIRALLTQRFDLKTMTVSSPVLNIQQSHSGIWNVQALVENFPESNTDFNIPEPSNLTLPQIDVNQADITITDATGTRMRFENSGFKGKAQGTKSWTFSGNLGQGLQLSGDLELDPNLSHSLALKYTDVDNLIKKQISANLANLSFEGHWQGHLGDSGLSGTLKLDKARADTFSCNGDINIEANLQSVKASIKAFTWCLPQDPNHPIVLESGQVRWFRQENLIHLDQALITGFGGSLTTQLTLPLNTPLESQALLTLVDLDLAKLPHVVPELDGLAGKASGTLKTRITHPGEQALEPLKLTLALTLQDGHFNHAQIRSIQATAYMGPNRWILDQSNIALLNGAIRFWARSTQHDDERLTYINTDFNDIDLKQAMESFGVESKQAMGRASGKGVLVMGELSGMTGQLDITVDQADLLNTLVIGTLYNALSLNFFNTKAPTGKGRAKLVLDYHTLHLKEFEYFNRGIEIRGSGTAQDVSLGPKTPIQGYVMASTRPLKGLKLPGLSDLDQLLTSLQKGTATVTVKNTLEDPKVSVVPFAQVQDIMKEILWVQLNPASKKNKQSEASK